MANVHQAGGLKRNISLTERIKPKNEHIYEFIDVINQARKDMKLCTEKITVPPKEKLHLSIIFAVERRQRMIYADG